VIFVECDPDKYVVKKIVPRTEIRHGGGKTGVLRALEGERRQLALLMQILTLEGRQEI
jgi:hypothetical protein